VFNLHRISANLSSSFSIGARLAFAASPVVENRLRNSPCQKSPVSGLRAQGLLLRVRRQSLRGFYKGHGYASADAADGEVVYGRIYLILERDAERMDYFEGVPYFGVHEKVVARVDDFEFYFYRTTRALEGLRPTREYLDYIVDAYRQMPAVPADYLAAVEATEVLERFEPLDVTGVFVSDIDRWPVALKPLLLAYERFCSKLVEAVWHRSPLQWMIRI
jgi:gamma-glutamylcyclotransferase (GGCT)/AIG2-like uncharacterized protein YtfP